MNRALWGTLLLAAVVWPPATQASETTTFLREHVTAVAAKCSTQACTDDLARVSDQIAQFATEQCSGRKLHLCIQTLDTIFAAVQRVAKEYNLR